MSGTELQVCEVSRSEARPGSGQLMAKVPPHATGIVDLPGGGCSPPGLQARAPDGEVVDRLDGPPCPGKVWRVGATHAP